jgi:hypothetical protein
MADDGRPLLIPVVGSLNPRHIQILCEAAADSSLDEPVAQLKLDLTTEEYNPSLFSASAGQW